MSFQDRVVVDLVLTRAGQTFAIPAGNVRELRLELGRAGFSGEVEFVLRDDSDAGGKYRDELGPVFLTPKELEVSVLVVPRQPTPEGPANMQPIAVAGVCVGREMREEGTNWGATPPVFWRRYRIGFVDPARAHWDDHFPCALYTNASLLSVVQAQATTLVKVESDWSAAQAELPQLFLHLPYERHVSFLAFLVWYLDRLGGCLVYDYRNQVYRLASDESSGEDAANLFGDDLSSVRFQLGNVERGRTWIRNSYAPDATSQEGESQNVIEPLVQDHLVRTSVASEQNARVELETLRRTPREVVARIELARFGAACTAPGGTLTCVQGQRFGSSARLLDGPWTIVEVNLVARATATELDTEADRASVGAEVSLAMMLRKQTDVRPDRQAGKAPDYPAFVEGLVVSQQGASDDVTWDSVQDEGTKANVVEIELPLFAKSVFVPFEPGFDSSNTFRPRVRRERVLVALGLHDARIARVLSFREEAALERGTQGEQMVFGRSAQSITKMSHVYESDQPVFDVTRTNGSDMVKLTFSEGTLTIGVQEQSG